MTSVVIDEIGTILINEESSFACMQFCFEYIR
jgi:hypothetical protein